MKNRLIRARSSRFRASAAAVVLAGALMGAMAASPADAAAGQAPHTQAAGFFAVVEKNKDHHWSLYDDAWMPNMLRITWNGIALHGGPLPGYAASHGCVRMPYDFAARCSTRRRWGCE